MRAEDSAVADSKCQRCGKKHRRGFTRGSAKHDVVDNTLGGYAGAAVGPVPWQQFTQVSYTRATQRCVHAICGRVSTFGQNRSDWRAS